MSDRFRIVLFVVVMVFFFIAVKLIRRKRLNLNYSLLWLFTAGLLLLMVLFPDLVYALSRLVGIDMPINMLYTAFAFFALVMMFYLTCIVSKDNEKSRTTVQQLALLEKRIRDLEGQVEALSAPAEDQKTDPAKG